MTERCRAYHRAKIEIMTMTGVGARIALMRDLVKSGTPEVARLIARESVSARLGRLVGDPGRGLRTVHRTAEADRR